MIEKFVENESFIKRLMLPKEMETAILAYHCEKNSMYNFTDDGEKVLSDRGLPKTYGNLLKIARTLYIPEDMLSKLDLEYDLFVSSPVGVEIYATKYKPLKIDEAVWVKLVKAFAYGGYLRPMMDERCMLWAEIDYVFSYLIEHFTDKDCSFSEGLPMLIGCLNPRTNHIYESFAGELTYDGILRVFRYLAARFGRDIFLNPEIQNEYERFVSSILDNRELCLLLSRADVLRDINKIYHDMPVVIVI